VVASDTPPVATWLWSLVVQLASALLVILGLLGAVVLALAWSFYGLQILVWGIIAVFVLPLMLLAWWLLCGFMSALWQSIQRL